jgi:hypothetical protein
LLGSTIDQTGHGLDNPAQQPRHIAPAPEVSSSAASEVSCSPVSLLTAPVRKSGRPQLPPLLPQIVEQLHLAYVGTVREVSANLNRIAARTGVPKTRLKYEAKKRGWRCQVDRRAWNPQEVDYLKEKLGTASITRIAHDLKRSVVSVRVKTAKLRLSIWLSEGYNISDLGEVFGLHHSRIESWARRGLLGKPHGHGGHGGNIRFAEASVVRFIRRYPSEYNLGRVDETWFKSMVFGRYAGRM